MNIFFARLVASAIHAVRETIQREREREREREKEGEEVRDDSRRVILWRKKTAAAASMAATLGKLVFGTKR